MQARPHNRGGESFLQLSGGFLLPTVPRLVGFRVLEIFRMCEGQLCPRRHHQTCPCHRVFALTNCLEARSGALLQMPDHQLGNEGGPVPHNTQTVCPNWQIGPLPFTLCALVSPKPPADEASVANTLASSGAEGVPRIVCRHLHTSS